MKNMIKLSTISALAFVSISAQASVNTATQRLASDLGTQQAIDATATCDLTVMTGANGGNLGTVNQLLCVVKTLNLTGAGEETRTVTIGNQSMTLHYKLDVPGITADGVTYDYGLSLWTCGSNCTAASSFLPAIYSAFSASADKSINKGILINNYGATSGSLMGTSFIKWDTGSGTTAKSIVLNMVDCSSSPTTANYSVYKRNGDMATLNSIGSTASGSVNRIALSVDYASNTGNWFEDTTVSAGGDSPSWTHGFTRATSGTDWSYTDHATYGSQTIDPFTTAMSGTTLSGASNQGVSCAGVTAAGGVTAVNNGTNVLTTPVAANGGMSLHPSSL